MKLMDKAEVVLTFAAVILFCFIIWVNSSEINTRFETGSVAKFEKSNSIEIVKKSGWIKIKSEKKGVRVKVYRNGLEVASFSDDIFLLPVKSGDVVELEPSADTIVEVVETSENVQYPKKMFRKNLGKKINVLSRVKMR